MSVENSEKKVPVDITGVREFGSKVADNISRVIVGKEQGIELILVSLLSQGHILIEDVPGVGKTMLSRALAVSLGCSFNRIQCTPDLLPSDVTGVSVFDQKRGEFLFRPGPVMSQVLLVDEINRATPRTQSSLLECMGEGQVTVDGRTYEIPKPFLVLATQNPVEYEGTFPLPEAQLDRFFLRLSLGYPTLDEESRILIRLQGEHPIHAITPCTTPEEVERFQREIRNVFVEPSVREYMVRLVQESRKHPEVLFGASPRGSLALFRASQALAALRGRDFVLPDDVKHLAVPILAHRVILKPESHLRGYVAAQLVRELLQRVPVNFEPDIT